jgi:hypothetical protein
MTVKYKCTRPVKSQWFLKIEAADGIQLLVDTAVREEPTIWSADEQGMIKIEYRPMDSIEKNRLVLNAAHVVMISARNKIVAESPIEAPRIGDDGEIGGGQPAKCCKTIGAAYEILQKTTNEDLECTR